MTHPEAARRDVLGHRPFDMDIIPTPIGRPNTTAQIGVTEVFAAPKTDGAASGTVECELAQRAEPYDITS